MPLASLSVNSAAAVRCFEGSADPALTLFDEHDEKQATAKTANTKNLRKMKNTLPLTSLTLNSSGTGSAHTIESQQHGGSALKAKLGVLPLALLTLAWPALAADWRPIVPEELALKQSKTDPNADAEALFRDVRIENSTVGANQNVRTTYIRIKIFNDRGREKYSNVKIEYLGKEHVSDVSGRTIHADGTIIDLKKDAIFDKVEIKKGGLKVKVISFALPSVEPGSIIEYRWMNNAGELNGFYTPYIPLDVQTEYPVDEVTFHLKPFNSAAVPADMRFMPFGCNPERAGRDSRGFTSLTVRNVPAYHDEPFSPPIYASRQWILVYYEDNTNTGKDKYWTSLGREQYGHAKEHIKINGEIKETAAEIISKGKTDDEKLALLAEHCRKNIKNIWGDDITTEEREQFKPNNNAVDTLRRQVGTSLDIDFAFIALAQAAGYDARYARVADRRSFLFTPELQSGYFLNNADAAVSVDGKWKFYDVSDPWAPPGTLTWPEQGVYALLLDSKNSEWVQTPLLTSDDTKKQRIADLKLSADGDVEGDIRELYWGNEAIAWRIQHARQNDAEREEFIRERLKERFVDFEATNIKVTLSPNTRLPVGVSYHLHVKGYAQRTGKRIFLHPGFFTAGQRAYFTEATRNNVVYFDYPWSETDSVDIHLPVGFELDHPERPAPLNFPPVGKYVANISIVKADNTLLYRRGFVFGNSAVPEFDPKTYNTLKSVFDQVHTNDEHMITLKVADTQPAAQE